MSLLGVNLSMLVGKGVPAPAPLALTEALDNAQVTHNDEGRSGFQLTFRIGRSGKTGFADYPLVLLPLLRPFNRLVLIVTLGAFPHVLIDGVITNSQMNQGSTPGSSTLSVTGEDLSVLMDMEERSVEHPMQSELVIANKIIARYSMYGILPAVIPPPSADIPLSIERTPVQRGTDLSHLRRMADRFGYVFYMRPGKVPLTSLAYWGPPVRVGVPQPALTANFGADSNINSIDFQYDALRTKRVVGRLKDRKSNKHLPVRTFASTRVPLASQPALPANLPDVRTELLESTEGLSYPQAWAQAQGVTNKSMDDVLTASGELDAMKYGGLLEPRGLIGVRGVGYQHDGLYYVKSVTHSIREGEYTQQFGLSREGFGALTPVVRV